MENRTASEGGDKRADKNINSSMKITAKNAVAAIGGIAAVVSFSRVCVLFLEALATVRDERSQDSELLEICKSGIARGSLKMRSACLSAQSERASPIVLKAILRAVSIAFEDFSHSVSSPGKLMIVILFIISSIFLPVASWMKALMPHDDENSGNAHVVVLANDSSSRPRLGFRNRVVGALKMRRGKKASALQQDHSFDVECDQEDSLIDIDALDTHTHAKWD